MFKKIALVTVLVIMASLLLLAGCGDTTVQDRASDQINKANTALARASAKGVKVSDVYKKEIAEAQKKLQSDSTEALVLATDAKANIENDVKDAFAIAEQTFNVARGAAETAMSTAQPGSDLSQAKASLAKADAAKAAAKTIPDWYDATKGPIYFANLAAQQASAASRAAASSQAAQATAAEMQRRIEQGSTQMLNLMSRWLVANGHNPADFKLGITKISSSSIDWATGAATPLTPLYGSQNFSFLFQYVNGNWELRAAPSWTRGQFGAPADMVP